MLLFSNQQVITHHLFYYQSFICLYKKILQKKYYLKGFSF